MTSRPDSSADTAANGTEQFARCNGVDLCYQTFGDGTGEPLLLIMGLGGQMITWPDGLCELLAKSGFYVIRFDNRDCGRSTHLEWLGTPRLRRVLARLEPPPYTLETMADDAISLLNHLQLPSAHILGASLGGMVAQTLVLKEPDRVRSLVSMMSSTGSWFRGQASLALLPLLLSGLTDDRRRTVDTLERALAIAGSTSYATDAAWTRQMLESSFDRGFTQSGFRRQLTAGLTAPNRARSLARVTKPTLVIHGTADRLVAVSGGRATARAVPTAHLLELAGMGHDLPAALWPVIVTGIRMNSERSQSEAVK